MTGRKTLRRLLLACVMSAISLPALAGSLENMERERAILLETVLSGDISAEERQRSLEVSKVRLADLERMVLRDESLVGRDQPAIRNAFENYDLTFIVHASTEHRRTIADHWLSELGLSTQAVMNGRMGLR